MNQSTTPPECDFFRRICVHLPRMRELSGSGRLIKDAVIGAVGPTYINILVPSQTTQTLESSQHRIHHCRQFSFILSSEASKPHRGK